MSNEEAESSVASEERLARFVLFSKWFRTSDQTVKPDAFIPYPYPDLSVTRHKNLSEQGLWEIGQGVATTRTVTLYGRADVSAAEVRRQTLEIELAPTPENPNHANIIDWPADKPAQKSIAQQLAAASHYFSKPKEAS